MTEKILSLERLSKKELRAIDNHKLEKIYNDLEKLHFFDNRNFVEGDEMIFNLMQLNPNSNDSMDENNYIRQDFYKNNRCFKSTTYNFDLRTISSMG